ncbi:peptidoglycan D,D-transpeptidase FtsI family protein [Heyndrickxia ginsengihumi]|uniref:peptidoglycan D,D-transpeptidase FtsI family protein n=1 Tax=Heyndrickxia ginsengihumi TaxID=363870 RepID=UPI000472EBF9|nr:penicillin-binding protein 2 [Heyndrickxia ginsengihumi]MBE6183778.1 penicillin-binding protein 2 [Bacillus sp. (in: firmicutes)]
MKKKKRKKGSHIPFRMNMLFFVVFVLFSVLVLRLGIVQIVYGQDYKKELEQSEDVTVNTSVPRGRILDRNDKLIVGNKPLRAITYTRTQSADQQKMLKVAESLAKIISKDSPKDLKQITERDKKDFWILIHPKEAAKLVSKKEQAKLDNDSDKIYALQLKRITKKDLDSLTKQDLEVLSIYREMSSGYTLSPQIIKNQNVTNKEYAKVSENLESLPGVDITTDWERYYVFKEANGDSVLGSVLGGVTSEKEGLPSDKVQYYTARDYSRNDRVGKSYLEEEYEDVLKGEKEKIKNQTDKSGNVLKSLVVSKGERGSDLVLSVDIDLQQQVEKIITQELQKARASNPLVDRAFVTVMNPNTGEVLTMAGKQFHTDTKTGKVSVQDFALGNMTTSYPMGSAVKGATVLTGYQTGAIKPGQVFTDEPLHFKGTSTKKSWVPVGFGNINDLYALRVSSNVYMFRTAMSLGGQKTYKPYGTLDIDKIKAINTFRKYFAEFGLGVKTGIDLPGEQTGYQTAIPPNNGNVLDFAIGQFDTYTPLQLAQYVSTIANGGYRVQPHIAKEIREPSKNGEQLGPVEKEIGTKVLNRIDMSQSEINRVKQGFYDVAHAIHGTAYGHIDQDLKVAGKTGTAQAVYGGEKVEQYEAAGKTKPEIWNHVWNSTFVGYAPYNKPEIAISVVVPWSYVGDNADPHTNLEIANRVFKAYFDLKKKHEKENSNQSSTQMIQDMKK